MADAPEQASPPITPGEGPSTESLIEALRRQPPKSGRINELVLAGVVIEEPIKDLDRRGEEVSLLLIAFLAPDSPETIPEPEIACCEIEVPGDQCIKDLVGKAIIVKGMLTGGGGVLASEIVPL